MHRYGDTSVLQNSLIGFGFRERDIRLMATKENGFEVQLPRKLTPGEMEEIHHAFQMAESLREAEDDNSDE
nr:uncharacterized protein CTRU02_07259 [Colletotrichum truncatum]KAF6791497.1 hypothetical protein CTRU02_07259 [Colletotrichum truncatum]